MIVSFNGYYDLKDAQKFCGHEDKIVKKLSTNSNDLDIGVSCKVCIYHCVLNGGRICRIQTILNGKSVWMYASHTVISMGFSFMGCLKTLSFPIIKRNIELETINETVMKRLVLL